LWTSRFDKNPAIVGQVVEVHDTTFTIVGVAPPGFLGVTRDWSPSPDLWLPLTKLAAVTSSFDGLDVFHQRDLRWLLVVGRLASGATHASTQAEMPEIAGRLSISDVASNKGWG